MTKRSRTGKFAVLIDAASLQTAAASIGIRVDYARLLSRFSDCGSLVRAFYFVAIAHEDGQRPLIDWLDFHGFIIVPTIVKEFFNDGQRRIKRDVGVSLASTAMEIARHVDQIVLVASEEAYRHLVEALQRQGVRVTVVSTSATEKPICAKALKHQADRYVDLYDIRNEIASAPRHGDRC